MPFIWDGSTSLQHSILKTDARGHGRIFEPTETMLWIRLMEFRSVTVFGTLTVQSERETGSPDDTRSVPS